MVMPPRIGPKKPVRVFLKLHREKMKLSQEQLGNRFSPPVDKGTVSRWETAPPGLLTTGVVAAFAEALDKPVTAMYSPPPDDDQKAEESLDDMAAPLDPDMRDRVKDVIQALKGRKAG